jgi:hypothetical protein
LNHRRRLGALSGTAGLGNIAGTALLSPMFIPLLPVDSLVRYQTNIDMHPPADQQYMLSSPLSPYFTLQFGWPTLVAKVASVYDRLPLDDRPRATIFGRTYSDASAVDFFGKQFGLPKAISGHVSYYFWGPGKNTSDVVIFVGYTLQDLAPFCRQLEIGEQMYDPYAYPGEMNIRLKRCGESTPVLRLVGGWLSGCRAGRERPARS